MSLTPGAAAGAQRGVLEREHAPPPAADAAYARVDIHAAAAVEATRTVVANSKAQRAGDDRERRVVVGVRRAVATNRTGLLAALMPDAFTDRRRRRRRGPALQTD